MDCGSGSCKVGFAGHSTPLSSFPSIIGRPKYSDVMDESFAHADGVLGVSEAQGDFSLRDFYVGSEAQSMRGVLYLQHPVEHGVVTDWEAMETLWRHALYGELKLNEETSNPTILLTESPLCPKKHREQCTQLMFETFNASALCIKVQAALSLYSQGLTTGCVLESGDGVTHAVPILEGYTVNHAINRVDLAGCDVTGELRKLLRDKGYSLHSTTAEFELVRDIKEKLAYVATDFEEEITTTTPTSNSTYELPDGQLLNIGKERFTCAEILFQPHLIGRENSGLHGCLYQSILSCDIDIRRDMYSTILLSGGNMLIPGMERRMKNELQSLISGAKLHISTAKSSSSVVTAHSAWIGGSILATLPTFSELCVNKQDYDEYGPSVAHKICL